MIPLVATGSCTHKNDSKSSDEVQDEGNANVASSESKTGDAEEDEDPDELPHPARADAWHTNKLLLRHRLPERAKLNSCRNDLLKTATENVNGPAMIEAEARLVDLVDEHFSFYHWCFYNSIVWLDWSLQNELSKVMIEKRYETFTNHMRGYWLLARALDNVAESKTYFKYLRKRYIQMSHDYFGRDLDIVAPPMDIEYPAPKPKLRKPAKPQP